MKKISQKHNPTTKTAPLTQNKDNSIINFINNERAL